jgi:hypothetical protein
MKTISKCIIASSSVNFIHNSLLSFFYFLLFWFAHWFSGFVVQLLIWSSSFLSFSMCVHWLTSFFLFRHCPLISCNVFNCATLSIVFCFLLRLAVALAVLSLRYISPNFPGHILSSESRQRLWSSRIDLCCFCVFPSYVTVTHKNKKGTFLFLFSL